MAAPSRATGAAEVTISQLLTGVVTVIYVGIAIAHCADGRMGLGLTFLGYAVANIGLIIAEG